MKQMRMFEIIYLLLAYKKMTTNELAAYFDVSKRTILRDIEALTMVGVPLYTTKGRGGGISLIDTYVLNKQLLTEEEQRQILLGLQSMAVTLDPCSNHTLKKMQTLFASDPIDWLTVDISRWGTLEKESSIFNTIKASILNEQVLVFDYINSEGIKAQKQVYPLKLIFKASAWYLQAYCTVSGYPKTYKLNRMLDVALETTTFSRNEYAVPPIETAEIPKNQEVAVEILFSNAVVFRAYDEFAASMIQTNPDGTVLVSTVLPENQWLYSFLLSLGGQAKVLAPQSVQKELLRQMTIASELYTF